MPEYTGGKYAHGWQPQKEAKRNISLPKIAAGLTNMHSRGPNAEARQGEAAGLLRSSAWRRGRQPEVDDQAELPPLVNNMGFIKSPSLSKMRLHQLILTQKGHASQLLQNSLKRLSPLNREFSLATNFDPAT